ncbi:MAG: serine protease [Saprospiraceae bacterium]|nr:serine protease [Saprospiraceae bacterium]
MPDFLSNADIYLTTFWYVAIPVSLIFIVQTVLTFAGVSHDSDIDTEVSHDIAGPMELFTLRNMINFLLGFSWGGICFYNSIEHKFLLVLVAIITGVIFVALFFYIIQQVKKLEEDHTFDIHQIKGLVADVYLRIPENQQGKGKIQVSLHGSMHELEAVTLDTLIQTGEKVVVLDIFEENIVLVGRIE